MTRIAAETFTARRAVPSNEGGPAALGSSPGDYCNGQGSVASSRGRRGGGCLAAPLQSYTEGGYGEQAEDQGQRPCAFGDGVARYAVAVCAAQRAASAWSQVRLWPGAVRCLLGAFGREGDPELCDASRRGQRQGDHDAGRAAGAVGDGAG